MGFRTRQIHAGVTPDPMTGAILTPIYQTTTYVQPSVDEYLSKGVLATMLAFLEAGKHAIVSDVAYGGTYRLSTKILSRFGIDYTFADTSNADDVAAAVRENTALILTVPDALLPVAI